MKILLRADVHGIGRRGDIVEVAGGYARNYLLPQGHATVATAGIESQAAAMRRSRDLRESRDREAAVTKISVLADYTLTIEARAGANGKLFGSVGPVEVVDALRHAKNIEIDRHDVVMPEHFKAVGSAEVTLRFFSDLTTTLPIEIVAVEA